MITEQKPRQGKANSFYKKIKTELEKLEINEEINRIQLIKSIWNDHNEWIDNSFRVNLCRVRKTIAGKKFVTVDGIIKRVV